MAEDVTCLLRVGNRVRKYKILKLDRDKVTIGRNVETTYPISSNMISQCHAVIEHQGDNTWSITDNKSLHGTFVNGQQLKPFAARTLSEGDMVQFGVPPSPDATAQFVYKFCSSLKALQMKDMEQKLLENQLNETKQENVTAKLQVLKAREDLLSNFVELMETELQCSICSELFVQATSLNCSHVFCKLCISQWMKVKNECPNCRCQITSQLPAITLDRYIDKMVEQFDDEIKQRRAVFIEQRKAEQVKFDASEAGPSCQMAAGAIPNTDGAGASSDTGTSSDTGNRRAQGSSRGGVTFGPGGSVTVGGIRITGNSRIFINGREIIREGEVQPQAATTGNCIVVNNVGSTPSSQSVYVSSYQNGFDSGFTGYDPGVYYGGYDHCYICGLNGHSSNRCPSLR